MRFSVAAVAVLPIAANAANIVLSNDDGWAEKNIRVFYDALTSAGENVVLSAPAENQSGTGSSEATPSPRTQPCQFNSCPANSPATGAEPNNPRINYVNSFPVNAIRFGIQTLAPRFFGGSGPQFAVSGPNVGSNVGLVNQFSGTVGAAVEATNRGVPAIAFSGASGSAISFTAATPVYAQIYADLAVNITQAVLASGAPLLPQGVFLNVNFPASSAGSCGNVRDFKFVLSRVNNAFPIFTPPDVETCGTDRLPDESDVINTAGCFVAISPADASDKSSTSAANQAVVLRKLGRILSCLP